MSDQSIASRIKSNKRHLDSVIRDSIGFHSKQRKISKKCKQKSNEMKNGFEFELNINDLNDYALESILSRLSLMEKMKCELVCKRWQTLICHLLSKQTAIGMKNIGYNRSDCSLNTRHSVINEDLIDRAVFEFSVQHMDSNEFDLRNAIQRNESQCFHNLNSIFMKCPKILSLDLRSIELNDSLVDLIADCCPQLECLHLNSMDITDSVWHLFTKRLSNRLIHLTIRNSIKSNQELIVENFVRNCCQLKSLKITEWNEQFSQKFKWFDCFSDCVDEIEIACTSAKSVFKFIESKSTYNIKRFKLSTFEALSQSVIDSIGTNFHNLTQINLRNCEGFTKRSYRPIANLVELKHLTMDLPFANCDEDFTVLAQNCTKMRSIEFNFGLFTLNSLQMIGKHWPQLESVSFRFVTIEKLNSEALDVFCNWKDMRRLSLHGTNITDHICQVIESSKTLRYLNLDLCNFISKRVVQLFCSSAKHKPKELFELSIKETKINKFQNLKNFNIVSDGVVKWNNLFVYYTSEDI